MRIGISELSLNKFLFGMSLCVKTAMAAKTDILCKYAIKSKQTRIIKILKSF